MRSQSKRRRARWRPACPITRRRSGSCSSVPIACGQGAGVAPRHDQPRHTVLHHLGQSARVARHHRHLTAHRLRRRNAEALFQGGDDRHRGSPVVRRQVGIGDPTEERDILGNAQIGGQAGQLGPLEPVTCKHDLEIREASASAAQPPRAGSGFPSGETAGDMQRSCSDRTGCRVVSVLIGAEAS